MNPLAYNADQALTLCKFRFFELNGKVAKVAALLKELQVNLDQCVKDQNSYRRKVGARSLAFDNHEDVTGILVLQGREPKLPGFVRKRDLGWVKRAGRHIQVDHTVRGKTYDLWIPGTSSRKKVDKDVVKERHADLKRISPEDPARRIAKFLDQPSSSIHTTRTGWVMTYPMLIDLGGRLVLGFHDCKDIPDKIRFCKSMSLGQFFTLAEKNKIGAA